tara:strand:+ start:18829 stop:19146 length:318 start_codon:yes stop_codon:yes gene_type:complete
MHRFERKTILIALVPALLMGAITASAQSQDRQPPKPDITGMASALGVNEGSLKTCMPAPAQGQRPSRPDAGEIASCLNNAGASDVSKSSVDKVLRTFSPKMPNRN